MEVVLWLWGIFFLAYAVAAWENERERKAEVRRFNKEHGFE